MQSLNSQLGGLPNSEQFFGKGAVQQQGPVGMNGMLFSPSMNSTRMMPQQSQQPHVLHGLENNGGLQNSYLLKQKMDVVNSAFGQQNNLQQQQQPGKMPLPNNGQVPMMMQNSISGGNSNNNTIPQQMQFPMPVQQQAMGNVNGLDTTPLPNASHTPISSPAHLLIREVWQNNVNFEFAIIRKMIEQYKVISISTEFVGTIARPIGNFRSKTDYHYQTMRSNVDLLTPIQIGLSLSDLQGNKPDNFPSTWQFNFHFDVTKETVNSESLELLKKSGVILERHQQNGVDFDEFAQLMMDSGLLLNDEVTWISYHAAYDYGFLINRLMNTNMPNNKEDFEWWVQKYIPTSYDLNLINKLVHEVTQQHPHPPPLHLLQSQQQQQQNQQQQYTLELLADELGIPIFPLFSSAAGQSLLALLAYTQLGKLSLYKLRNGTDFSYYKNLIYGITQE
ncbi:CCR4-NOT core DEDD family RNase subunit POP2 [Kluyveromyces lactis]|uniref:poly(A)-specific ribonuclease n=1 Tax=Kluyveromyces lactis (strain ATCC 8585 / CBS 2359 / DSM 70799 / NBRC 1267 / NRRL Y-1140 / WM37) TaxID=284590 RepID=Q6CSQ0_KLULA|nr:uncharacterized protein KLLA0_C18821g [Kluyveromyces lactis]CAH01890.1 KLLA0C18821p [Kluyveromyces lactis]|eukprot:XP_453039.1 uncharacterized protein KLLA0_C18821g [Kluyveromyces lactis]